MIDAPTSQPIRIDAGGWGISWVADDDGRLHQLGLGPDGHTATLDVGAQWYPIAFPTLDGTDPFRPPALQIIHADGTLSTRLALTAVERDDDPSGSHVVVRTSDERFDLTVECIRRHYQGDTTHPLAEAFDRYRDFFDLFESFAGYVDFWLLDDLVDAVVAQLGYGVGR